MSGSFGNVSARHSSQGTDSVALPSHGSFKLIVVHDFNTRFILNFSLFDTPRLVLGGMSGSGRISRETLGQSVKGETNLRPQPLTSLSLRPC